MMDPQIISKPAPYGEGRSIEPIQVIEGWGLCHHLACAVKYIARAGRKNSILEDLSKAEWYLVREINAPRYCQCTYPVSSALPFAPEAIAADWELPARLGAVIFYITTFQKLYYSLPLTRIICLKQALKHLRVELQLYEFQEVIPLISSSNPIEKE